MKLDELKKLLVGLKPDTEVILCIGGKVTHKKLENVEIAKTESGTLLDEEITGITNKKVIILY